jgi:hypothetical protein
MSQVHGNLRWRNSHRPRATHRVVAYRILQRQAHNTIIQPQTIKQEEEKVNSYCYQHRETTIMDAVKNVLGFDK